MQNSTWDGIIRKKSTNINSINTINTMNTINTNNTTTTTVHPDGMNKGEVTPAESSGLASLSLSPCSGPGLSTSFGVGIPRNWKGLKLDLFLNGYNKRDQPQFKLTLGIIKLDGTTQPLRVNFNSPKDRIWLGVNEEQKSNRL
jgi:hypothetical protein